MKQIITPHLARIISSDTIRMLKRTVTELVRKVSGRPHIMEVFVKINDPYSYLLVQALTEIVERYNVTLRLRTIYSVNDEMFPEQALWTNNAFKDALKLATLYNLDMPKTIPEQNEYKLINITNQLVKAETSDNALDKFNAIFSHYWQSNEFIQHTTQDTNTYNYALDNHALDNETIAGNEKRLNELGHYMGAMIYFGGEWYWGIDRLDHFEQRANQLGLNIHTCPTVHYNRTYSTFCNLPPPVSTEKPLSPITVYFSIRSPYSHIGLERALTLAKHYNVELIIKPVLPMVMRGLAIPHAKKMYIFHDTKREANKYGIDYGYVADPLGAGVERCYALFDYALSEGKSVEYMLAYARAVNAKGIRSETDKGLKKILSSCGLDWSTAKPLLDQNNWTVWAEKNLQEMYSYGLWGVPSFKYKDITVWGQDRIFIIENQITADLNH